MSFLALSPDLFRLACDTASWSHQRSDQLNPFMGQLGQERALDAIHFSLGIRRPGYNLFAIGPPEIAKEKCVQSLLSSHASQRDVPADWVYVYNFDDDHKPSALALLPGEGRRMRSAMRKFIEQVRESLPIAFEQTDYLHELRYLEREKDRARSEKWQSVEQQVKAKGFTLVRTPLGMAVAPKRDGKVVTPDAFDALSDDEQDDLQEEMESLTRQVKQVAEMLPAMEKRYRGEKRLLQRKIASRKVNELLAEIKSDFVSQIVVTDHIERVAEYVVSIVLDALDREELRNEKSGEGLQRFVEQRLDLEKCQVNLFVDHGDQVGAPVIVAEHPNYAHLFGRVEYRAQLGTWATDHTLVKAGAIHQASGGFLILDARKMLQEPVVWEELKRVLRRGRLGVESLSEGFHGARPISLEPEQIPIDVKVALCGERWVYAALDAMDPDFSQLFKVAADFDDEWPRNRANEVLYVRKLAAWIAEEELLPFSADALACVVEQSARLAGDAQKLSTREVEVQDLLRESDFLARQKRKQLVERDSVQHAITAQRHRAARLHDRLGEQMDRGHHLIATEGSVVGQVNGLGVLKSKGKLFGQPARITARVWLGKGEIIDIEREAALAGPVHQKGVLILSGYLGQRYASNHPLSLCASLVFEQSYGAVEGDSATAAELVSILSAIAGVPVHQGIAVTGSVNQHGEIQAVGEVNTKIEGFFRICKRRGLRSPQGVILPEANVSQLMLPAEIQQAARQHEFILWPVRHVDEVASILMSPSTCTRADAVSNLHQKVEERLEHFSRLAAPVKGGGKGD